MRPRRYVFVTSWWVGASLDETWTFLTSPGQRWVDWWPALETADVRRADGLVGSAATCTWRSPAGYRLTFAQTLTEVEPGRLVVLAADGDLAGISRVRFAAAPGGTPPGHRAARRHDPHLDERRRSAARPAVRYGHPAIMRRGERGLRRVLDGSVADAGLPRQRGGGPGSAADARAQGSAADRPATGAELPGEKHRAHD